MRPARKAHGGSISAIKIPSRLYGTRRGSNLGQGRETLSKGISDSEHQPHLPHAASLGTHHRVGRLATERLLKLGHVLEHAIHAILARRMRVHCRAHARCLLTHVFAPDLGET